MDGKTTVKRISVLILSFGVVSSSMSEFPSPRTVRQPIIHPQIESIGSRKDGRIHAWVYFKDKSEKHDLPQKLSRIQLHPKTLERRLKVRPEEPITWWDIPVNEEYVSNALSTGARIRHKSKWLNAVSIVATVEQLQKVARLPFVTEIQPVLVYKRKIPPNRPVTMQTKRKRTTSLDYGYAQEQIEQINIDIAHSSGYVGQGVRVLIMDTGFYLDHEVFDSLKIVAEWDFIENDSTTANESSADSINYQIYGTQHDHGTMVFSVLAGYDPGGLIGPAFGAEFLLAKTEILLQEVQIEEDNYVAGLEWGESLGADVVSSSLGYLDWYTYSDMDGNTAAATIAVDIAVSLGVVSVTAAGNEGECGAPGPNCWYYIVAPADARSVISVGAVDSFGELAAFRSKPPFGSHGPTYDGRIKPEVCARGLNTASANPGGKFPYRYASGTSLSTPLVAGSAAVILSAHPDWTPMMVREALMETASRADNPDNSYGWGIIDVWAAINYESFSVNLGPLLPTELQLYQNFPNPFNRTTTIRFELRKSNRVNLSVFNLMGERVALLVDHFRNANTYEIQWNASALSSGIYIAQIRAGGQVQTEKMVFIK